MSFCAKMILLSKTQDEKSLYSLFAADEATHLREVQNFMEFDPAPRLAGNPFLELIADVVQKQSPEICHGILQVMIEGYGIHHYTALKNGCTDPAFKSVLARIIQDEAAHHGSGVLFTSQRTHSPQELEVFKMLITSVSQLLQCWAFPVLTAMELVVGHLSLEQKITLLEEIEMGKQTQHKMGLMKRVLDHGGFVSGLDTAWITPQACAYAHNQMLSRMPT